MRNLIKKVQNTAFQENFWRKGSKIVLGVSGGPDSVCLLDLMSKIAPKAGLELIIVHINYGLRGKDSDGDERFVKDLTEKHGLVGYFLKPKIGKDKSENHLRNIRYDFFEEVRKENEFDFVAVAHNADDQVETFLMRVIRGAGLHGLSAMQYKNGKIIRPLLGISRKEIIEYLQRNNLRYRTDKTNKENLFFRNKVRNKLIPYLEKNYNSNIKKTVLDSIQSIAEDADFLGEFSLLELGSGEISIKKILTLHPAIQRRIFLLLIKKKLGNLKNIETCHVNEVIKLIRSSKNKAQNIEFCGLKIVRKGDKLVMLSKK